MTQKVWCFGLRRYGVLDCIVPPFCFATEGSGEIIGQRENLLSSKLAARETLKVAWMCQAALRLEGHGRELGSLGLKSGHKNEDSDTEKNIRGLRGDY